MSEQYYRYQTNDTEVDVMNDDLYEYVLTKDRNNFRNLANTGPRCMNEFADMQEVEHFDNLNVSNKWVKTLLLAVVFVIVLYLIYTWCGCDNDNNSYVSDSPYLPNFEYTFARA